VSADGLAAFQWPNGVTNLTIFGHNDMSYAGQRAAYTLAFRARGKGLNVNVVLPERVDVDWNDLLRERRAQGARVA
jgi:hypothetical protein